MIDPDYTPSCHTRSFFQCVEAAWSDVPQELIQSLFESMSRRANRRIARHIGRSDEAFRRCWQEWVDSSRFQCHVGSGRPKATADREGRLIVRSAVTALDSSLSTLRRSTRTRMSIKTIDRHLIQRNSTS
ncbi:HTH_Tnp_Tc3_2 domain-containing protein [Trichonephila clavipes]|nr:HTH_Tnp_Tc3_2 domain-containing protein [Trichonephila clavipes]